MAPSGSSSTRRNSKYLEKYLVICIAAQLGFILAIVAPGTNAGTLAKSLGTLLAGSLVTWVLLQNNYGPLSPPVLLTVPWTFSTAVALLDS